MPWLIVRFPWGSRSTTSTEWPSSFMATARFRVVVVFATPPFWLARAMTCPKVAPCEVGVRASERVTFERRLTVAFLSGEGSTILLRLRVPRRSREKERAGRMARPSQNPWKSPTRWPCASSASRPEDEADAEQRDSEHEVQPVGRAVHADEVRRARQVDQETVEPDGEVDDAAREEVRPRRGVRRRGERGRRSRRAGGRCSRGCSRRRRRAAWRRRRRRSSAGRSPS